MSANPIWIAGYGPVAGAAPVWIAPGDGTVPSAVLSEIVSFFSPVAGATAVWIAGFFAPPPAAIGATPITISGWGDSGGGGGGGSTSVWSAADAAANGMTLSNGGLTVALTTASWQSIRGSISKTAGKFYVEFKVNAITILERSSNAWGLGIADASFVVTNYLGSSGNSLGMFGQAGNQATAGFTLHFSLPTTEPAVNDVWALAVDLTNGHVWIAQNNVWFSSGNPGSGANPFADIAAPAFGLAYFPAFAGQNSVQAGTWTLQSTATSQKYAPPSGFSAWDGGAALPPTSQWSAADASANAMTLSNGGLTVIGNSAGGTWQSIRNTISHTSGKVYVEFLCNAYSSETLFGFADGGFVATSFLGSVPQSVGITNVAANFPAGGFTANYTPPSFIPAANDVVALAIDFTAGSIWIAWKNAWVNSSNPATGSLPIISFVPATVGALFAAMTLNNTGANQWTLQSTAASQKYAPPSGFSAWDGGTAPPPTSVWSASDASANAMTLSNGGLTVVSTTSAWQSVRGSVGHASGRYYVEFKCAVAATANASVIGLADAGFVAGNYLSSTNYSAGYSNSGGTNIVSPAGFANNSSPSFVHTPALNDVYQLAVDLTAGNIWMGLNNSWYTLLAAERDPSTGSPAMINIVAPALGLNLFPAISVNGAASGTWTLQATAASQKYAPPSGFSAWDSAAPTHSPQALAYLARTVGGNEGGNGANIATLIDGLVSDSVWAKLDALYVLAQQNATDAKLNLVGTSYGLTPVGSPVFTPYKGFNGFSTTIGLDTGFNPTTAPSANYLYNTASMGVWDYASTVQPYTLIGGIYSSVYPLFTGNLAVVQINSSVFYEPPSTATHGLIVGERTDATTLYCYQNGVGTSQANSVSGADNANFLIGNPVSGGGNTDTLSAAFIGASLGAAGQLALYNRLRTYMTAIGVP